MPYNIPHRFLARLNHSTHLQVLRYVVIGTFNPGRPNDALMTKEEKEAYLELSQTAKFKRNDNVLNFYDRGPNRWWGILDRMNHPAYYQQHGINAKRLDGLKYYVRNTDRTATYTRQQAFCATHGILLTDLVRKIVTHDIQPIYNNYSDTFIDQCVPEDGWNTTALLDLISTYNPDGVLFTFSPSSSSIPNITRQINLIRAAFPLVKFLLTPAGAAGNSYPDLVADYQQKMPLHLP
jgi:hypothetical protein